MNQHLRRPFLSLVVLALLAACLPPLAQAQGHALVVYNDASYAGVWCYSDSPMTANIAATCNDQISSVQLLAGWSIRVYRDQNQGGPSACVNRSDANLNDNTFEDGSAADNAISSFTLYNQAWCAGSPTPAYPLEVYSDPNYGGSFCYSWQSEAANIYSSCNDLISSVLLRSGWSMRVYGDQSQGGARGCLTGSDSNLADNTFFDGSPMNDAISSFALYSQGNCANAAPNIPTLSGPANGSTATNGTVTLTWSDPGDPDSWPRTYRDYSAEIWKSDNSWSQAMAWQVTNSWTPPSLADGTYYWHVQSGDGWAGSGWSSTGSFSVNTGAQPSPDTTLPDGQITAPAEGATIGPSSLNITAVAADNPGGSGVDRVELFVFYDRNWYFIGSDSSAPYSVAWATPGQLTSQGLIFALHVIDKAGNKKIDAGGYRRVSFIQSSGGPGVVENWVAQDRRAYLNQLSLGADGWQKCSVTSMAMVLAMNGRIGKDQASLATKANQMWPNVLINGLAYVYKMRDELRRQGLASDYFGANGPASADQTWGIIKAEVNAGRPVILGSAPGELTDAGHFIVAVGYREQGGGRTLIAYDPYGAWQGAAGQYDRNSSSADSHKGQWVSYDFSGKLNRPRWLITARPSGQAAQALADVPVTPPDTLSAEPLDIVSFAGVPNGSDFQIFLPLTSR